MVQHIYPQAACSYLIFFPSECNALDVIAGGAVRYNSAEPSASGGFTGGTVATYSCADGYELVGEENRTCLVGGTWTAAEPQCAGHCCYICVRFI